jgi:hypothetical protein
MADNGIQCMPPFAMRLELRLSTAQNVLSILENGIFPPNKTRGTLLNSGWTTNSFPYTIQSRQKFVTITKHIQTLLNPIVYNTNPLKTDAQT